MPLSTLTMTNAGGAWRTSRDVPRAPRRPLPIVLSPADRARRAVGGFPGVCGLAASSRRGAPVSCVRCAPVPRPVPISTGADWQRRAASNRGRRIAAGRRRNPSTILGTPRCAPAERRRGPQTRASRCTLAVVQWRGSLVGGKRERRPGAARTGWPALQREHGSGLSHSVGGQRRNPQPAGERLCRPQIIRGNVNLAVDNFAPRSRISLSVGAV